MRAGAEPHLFEQVLAIHDQLERSGLPHAFGGALALAYYAEPRVTVDIDLNVFVAPTESGTALSALEPLGVTFTEANLRDAESDGQVRVRWNDTPVDLFFSVYETLHGECADRARLVPFGGKAIPILAAENLVVFKALFDRPKDWIDIEQVLLTEEATFEATRVHDWLVDIAGAGDPRAERFDQLSSIVLGSKTTDP